MNFFDDLFGSSYMYVLSEIGINHDGDINIARDLIKASKQAGADGVKFQLIKPETLLNLYVFEEGKSKTNTAIEIFQKYVLNDEDYIELAEYAASMDIDFICTCFDAGSVDYIDPYVKAHKISSGDITNIPLMKHVGSKQKPVIISTGMSNLHMVRQAVNAVKDGGGKEIILLHCVSLYPPSDTEVNLQAIKTLKKDFELPVGFSDHTIDDLAAIGAYFLGARFLEKHVTFNRSAPGADHAMSIEIKDFELMIKKLRRLEDISGTGEKIPAQRENDIAKGAFRGLYAKEDIKKGELFSSENVLIARPSSNLTPGDFFRIQGKTALKDIQKGFPIKSGDF